MTPNQSRRALLTTVALLIAAAVALGSAAALGWGRVGFQVPLRGIVAVPVAGSDLLPALGPLALLALAAVAAVLATGGWARRVLGMLLLVAAVPPVLGVLRAGDATRLSDAAASAGELPARSAPNGAIDLFTIGPGLAATGAMLLAGAGVALMLRGHRMPLMGRRYRAPTPAPTPVGPPAGSESHPGPERRLWERIDAGEDPTVPDDPR